MYIYVVDYTEHRTFSTLDKAIKFCREQGWKGFIIGDEDDVSWSVRHKQEHMDPISITRCVLDV